MAHVGKDRVARCIRVGDEGILTLSDDMLFFCLSFGLLQSERGKERERERGMNTTTHLLPCTSTSIARLLPQNELSFLKFSLSSFALGLSVSSFCIAQYVLTPTKYNFRACSKG